MFALRRIRHRLDTGSTPNAPLYRMESASTASRRGSPGGKSDAQQQFLNHHGLYFELARFLRVTTGENLLTPE
jgi:hypothetical protein